MEPDEALVALLAAILRGDWQNAWAARATPVASLLGAAQAHGVLPLVHRALGEAPESEPWTRHWHAGLAPMARTEAAVEAIQSEACREVLAGLADASVPALVFKGGALAHTHYASPDLRPRDDTDLLVEQTKLEALHRVLTELGYRKAVGTEADLVSRQRLYSRVDGRGIRHNFDVHWRLSNRHRYAALFTGDELYERAVALPGHPAEARCPGPPDAMLIAALHRASHRGVRRLVWLYDIHLLASMSEEDRARLVRLAEEKQLLAECRDAWQESEHRLGGTDSQALKSLLAGCPALQTDSAPGPWDRPRSIDIWLSDLKALPHWRARLALLKGHAFPPAGYMLARAGCPSAWLLPWLYLERAIRGTLRLFKRL